MLSHNWQKTLQGLFAPSPRKPRRPLGSSVEVLEDRLAPAAAVMVSDINTGSGGSTPVGLTNVDGMLFFSAHEPSAGTELWKSDGTAAGTVRVKDINPGPGWSEPRELTNVGGTLFFSASDGTSGRELWKSDGTEAGTVRVRDIRPGLSSTGLAYLTAVEDILYFAADGDSTSDYELWRSDGTEAGTVMVKDIYPAPGRAEPRSLTNVGGTLFFSATDGTSGRELWKSDGTEAGTVVVKDIHPGPDMFMEPFFLTNVGGTLFFTANDGMAGAELWRSDGTAAGTDRVRDINPGPGGSVPRYLTDVGGTLFFQVTDTSSGYELWKSDGTAAGTLRVKDIDPASSMGAVRSLTSVGDTLYFTVNDGTSGRELWKSDGTEAGTTRVKDINPGPGTSYPRYLTNVGGTLFFSADDGAAGRELWKSDGTEEGTVRVRDMNAGTSGSYPNFLTDVNGTLFLAADGGASGRELWKLETLRTGTPDNGSGEFTDADGDVYTVTLTGPGTVKITIDDPNQTGRGPVRTIRVVGTDPLGSVLTVSVKRSSTSGDEGTVTVGAITGTGLKAINLKQSDLVGGGIELRGLLGQLTAGALRNGADVKVAGGVPTWKTRLKLGEVLDGSDIVLDNAITTLTAASIGNGTIRAASAGSIKVARDGDFRARMTLDGEGVAEGRPVLGSLRVGGYIRATTIEVRGLVGLVQATGIADTSLFVGYSGLRDGSGDFDPSGTLKKLKVTGASDAFSNSYVIARSIRSAALRSVAETNLGIKFGLTAQSVGKVRVSDPAFAFDPSDPSPQGEGDFVVRLV